MKLSINCSGAKPYNFIKNNIYNLYGAMFNFFIRDFSISEVF